ncbi:SWIB/MDM2 domain superfamily protein [Tasmannia lanceolata]|uniref:SWIB/MDM2 domain superfamily protein n=1 Tax=Tasmannia lanceolata TaxID=3420 RepID=UPI004063391C
MSRVFEACRVLMAAAKAGAKANPNPRSASMAATTKAKTTTRPNGILKSVPVSPAMRKFLGVPEISRTEAVKKIWEYIKLNDLQNPANKREIICDEKLKTIFDGKDRVGFLEVARLMSVHFVKTT